MPRTWYGPFSEKDNNYAVHVTGNANLGRYALGSRLVLPDERSPYTWQCDYLSAAMFDADEVATDVTAG